MKNFFLYTMTMCTQTRNTRKSNSADRLGEPQEGKQGLLREGKVVNRERGGGGERRERYRD